jgi:predicted Zn-dependent protease
LSSFIGWRRALKYGEEIKSAWDVFLGNDIAAFDVQDFVKRIGDKLLAKFGGVQCASGLYPTVLDNTVFSHLINYFVSSTSSDEVQRRSSFLIGKLHQKIASSKVTISGESL